MLNQGQYLQQYLPPTKVGDFLMKNPSKNLRIDEQWSQSEALCALQIMN